MANFAGLIITFSGVSNLDSTINIVFTKNTVNYTRTWTCKTTRSQAFQYTRGLNANDQMGKFLSAATADLANDPQLYNQWTALSNTSTSMKFTATNYGWTTTDYFVGGAFASASTIPEVLPAKDFRLTGHTIAAGAVPCQDVALTITQSDGVAPYTWVTPSNAATGLTAQIARGVSNETISVTLEDSEADQATLAGVIIPQAFSTSLITGISVVPNTGGLDATVTAFLTNPDSIFTYEYSIDGTNFSTSNVFPNLTDGDYTLYVTDGFGCLIAYEFTVDIQNEIVRFDPYAVIPKANSIRFVKQEITKYQTLDNTLYHNEHYLGEYKPKYYQQYQSNDGEILTQFRSNYTNIEANIYKCDGNLVQNLTINQKSNNIGAEDKRDCTTFNLGDNQTGIFFTTGNIYAPGTTDITGTYNINGNVPEWGIVGNTVVISGMGSFVIKQVTYNDEVNAQILVIDYVWLSGNETEAKIVECTYNRQAYEVYEFAIDTATVGVSEFNYIVITMTDDDYPDLVFNSERIQVRDNYIRTNFIEYSGSEFTGIDYSTGYTGRVRVKSLNPYHQLTPGGEITTYKDSLSETIKLKDVATMEGTMFISEVPRYMVEKLRLIFSHEDIWINGEKWINEEAPDVQSFPHSALRNVNVKLRRRDYESYATNFIDLDGQNITGQEIIE